LVNSQVVPSYHDSTLPGVRQYLELTKRYQPLPPHDLVKEDYQPRPASFVGLEGFLNAKLLVTVLQRMGPPFERQRVAKAAESITDLDLGIHVPVSFRADKHQGSDAIYYTIVRDGQFESFQEWEKWRQ